MTAPARAAGGALARQEALRARAARAWPGFEPFPAAAVEQSIAACFEARVGRHPDRPAIRTRHQRLTYAALNAAANRLAHALLACRGERAEPVAVLASPGAPVIAAALGVLKTGKFQVPLDPALPRDRLRAALDHTRAPVVVADRAHAGLARDLGAGRPVIDLDGLAGEAEGNPGIVVAADAFAGITFTSGSTGTPKGIVHRHRGLMHAVMRHVNTFGLAGDDRQAFVRAGLSHMVFALLSGGTCYPVDPREDGLGAWLVEEKVTVWRSAVSAFRALVDGLRAEEELPDLRLALVFGEPAYRADVDRYRRHCSDRCLFVSSLGCREAGDYAYFWVDRSGEDVPDAVPGGYPVEGLEVRLLDEAGRVVPDGEVGEIAIRSRYCAAGYWERPDLTRAAFLPDPAGADARIYLTGDLGRRLPDGCLVHLGRKDLQIKVRGHRVDVGEVEAALLGLGGVKRAAVAAREHAPGDERLVAYLVPAGTALPAVSEMRRALADRLPAYMVPAAFVAMTELPLTASGKVDRRALPAPGRARPRLGAEPVAPRSPLEATLAAIWGDVLGLDEVGVHDAFLDLGGNSLLAVRVFAEIERQLGRKLPLAVVLASPTVEDLARRLERHDAPADDRALVAIQPRGARAPLYCVPEHTGTVLCFEHLARHLGPEQPLYGLEPRGLDGRRPPHRRIEEMARQYLEEIREVQPTGPYFLAGYCFGGLVALEMAQQLRARGLAVALLALFDTWGPDRPRRAPGQRPMGRLLARSRRRLEVEYANLRSLSLGDTLAYATSKAARVGSRLRGLVRGRVGSHHLLPAHIRAVARAHSEAERVYVPRSYPGPMTLFWSQRRFARSYLDPHFGWRGTVTGPLDVRLVPAASGSVIQDPTAARQVAAELARLMAGAAGGP